MMVMGTWVGQGPGTYDNAKISYSSDAVKLVLEDEGKRREETAGNIDGKENH
jgi:hypothetical protein